MSFEKQIPRVLIVDDELGMRITLQKLLKDEGFEVFGGFFGHFVGAGFLEFGQYVFLGVLAVEEFPYKDADGVQAIAFAFVWVKEDGPVVKFFSEHDVGIC